MTEVHDCCIRGFNWDGIPEGKEGKLGPCDTYVTGTNKDAAVMIIHDLYGWEFQNLRLLADHYAKEADATVYLPDFFHGEALAVDLINTVIADVKEREKHLPAFISRNNKHTRRDDIFACARALRSDRGHKRVGVIGFCFGGWAVAQLGGKSHNNGNERLVDCISTGHPTFLEKSEIDEIAVPVQILAPEHDAAYTQELKDYTFKVVPTLGVAFDYQYFPGVEHGFATRGNQADEVELKAMKRAKDAAVDWFRMWLHE